MYAEFARLVKELDGGAEIGIIDWSCPVPFFGHIESSLIATVGINPSNREFVDVDGAELKGDSRRFPTLHSLGLRTWSDAHYDSMQSVISSCRRYFDNRPYDAWFGVLNNLLNGTGHSYYVPKSSACHLDIVPWATHAKWSALSLATQRVLLNTASGAVFGLLEATPIQMLILNGRSVVAYFEQMTGHRLHARQQPTWSLGRGDKGRAPGMSYSGVISEIAGTKLSSQVLVVGYNHNLQSTFGVTVAVRDRVRDWVTEQWELLWE